MLKSPDAGICIPYESLAHGALVTVICALVDSLVGAAPRGGLASDPELGPGGGIRV